MAWYNPLSWFEKKPVEFPTTEDFRALYCANPQCGKPITTDSMTYEPQEREVVHPGQCQSLLIAHRVMRSGGMMFGNFETISRKDALALAKEGKLSERCLEKRLSA